MEKHLRTIMETASGIDLMVARLNFKDAITLTDILVRKLKAAEKDQEEYAKWCDKQEISNENSKL